MQLAFDFSRLRPEPSPPPHPLGEPRAQRPPVGRAALQRRIRRALSVPADLVVTDNRRTMISTKRRGQRLEVRLHHMFLDAPDAIVEELLSYLAEGDARASRRIGEYIENNRHRIKQRSRRILLRTQGEHHDLHEVMDEVAARWFPEGVGDARITWGKRPGRRRGRRRRQSIRLGTYTHDQKLVRIHPALDQAFVPRYFVSFVVFHELLHHVVPAREIGGRLDHHPPEFKVREQSHPDYARAIAWEEKNLDRLLRFD